MWGNWRPRPAILKSMWPRSRLARECENGGSRAMGIVGGMTTYLSSHAASRRVGKVKRNPPQRFEREQFSAKIKAAEDV